MTGHETDFMINMDKATEPCFYCDGEGSIYDFETDTLVPCIFCKGSGKEWFGRIILNQTLLKNHIKFVF